MSQGKLKPLHPVNETITFHDSCYLGRYNEVYEPPRAILKAIPGVQLKEMERSRENGMCCGRGRAHVDGRRNGSEDQHGRTEQALSVSPTVISSGCPYCLTMLGDGTKAKEAEDAIGTYDVSELLAMSVFGAEKQESL
nr:(Fe-S)-binding protein [Bacillus velezensis]